MRNKSEDQKAREAKQLKLPIVSFDHQVTRMLRDKNIDVNDDFDGHGELEALTTQRGANLFDYMTDSGLITEE